MRKTSRARLRRMGFLFALCVFAVFPTFIGQLIAQETKTIRIGYSALSLSFLPQLFARDAGVFKKHGLTVEIIQMAGPIQVAALAAGEIDFGAAVSPALFAAVRGLPLRGVMITVKTPLFYIVSEPSLKQVGGLIGKKVAVDAVGALQHISAKSMLTNKGVNPEQVFVNVDRYGNMSSASIPVALDEGLRSGWLTPGSLVLMVAFGAGFTWAANVIQV